MSLLKRIIALSILVSPLLFSSCVMQKKFDELLAEKVKLEADNAELTEGLAATEAKIETLEEEVENLTTNGTASKEKLNSTTKELNALIGEHAQLKSNYDNALNNSGQLSRDLTEQQQRIQAMQATLNEAKLSNEALATDLVEREKKVNELEAVVAKMEASVQDLKNKVTGALLNFGEKDLSVEVRDGKVYVSVAEQLLFNSGSTVVDPKGVAAIGQLASALKGATDINIMVEGHTDDVPMRPSKNMADNWDLSVLRATSISRILINGGIDPKQIVSAGKGEFNPVAENDTNENKAKNRRTEIILTPDLQELFKILDGGE